MTASAWPTEKWLQAVPREISGFEKPAFTILDDPADAYPDMVCTIFSGATRTYTQA
jgi:long-chain acyl-CoA synthetase